MPSSKAVFDSNLLPSNTRSQLACLVFVICGIPFILNTLGLDFASSRTPLSTASVVNGTVKADDLFYAIAGAMHHAILEWSAVSIAVMAALAAFLHYSIRRDVTVPIIGMSLLCAGLVDAFHTLAATRIIDAVAPNTDFIPFTWALSRVFNASIMITGAMISLWIMGHSKQHGSEIDQTDQLHGFSTIAIVSVIFITVAYIVVHSAAISDDLPQTMYLGALITRPYDVLPLALFLVGGTLFWTWYKKDHSAIKYALILSIIPEVTTQLHMAFGSTALFDNHFNIAHFLKIIAYSVIFIGILIDLVSRLPHADYNNPSSDDDNKKHRSKGQDYQTVGKATRPLGIQLPLAGFVLTLLVALIVGVVFYTESEHITKEKEVADLQLKGRLVSPLITNLYEQSFNDVNFLSRTPPIQGIVSASIQRDTINLKLWKNRLQQTFTEMLHTHPIYTSIRYIGIAEQGRELVNVKRMRSGIYPIPESRLQSKSHRPYFKASLAYSSGEVYFSKIELKQENGQITTPHLPVLRVATPIFNLAHGQLFGIVIISVNFEKFIKKLKDRIALKEVTFYLANQEGDYLVHPENNKVFGFDLGQSYRLQDDFPALSTFIQKGSREAKLPQLTDPLGQIHIAYYDRISLNQFGNQRHLRLLLQYSNETQLATLQTLRNRSILIGFSLALVVLALSVLATRRVIQALTTMTEGVQHYELSGKMGQLPIHSHDEIGVLARSFHNLLISLEEKSQREAEATKAAKASTLAKSEFVACMSHEIRTPMNGVLGMLGLLMRGELSQKQQHYATLARSSANALLSVINDILDFSKIDAGKLELQVIDFDLRSQLGEFAESMAFRAEEKGLELILNLTHIKHSMVKGDPGRLRQILTNLMCNAIKFTATGEVVVQASLDNAEGNESILTCSVTDTGVGIPKNKIDGLFDSFTQVDASTTRQFGGTGLGLAITKQLCELMGGSIKVRSIEGESSCFEFTITLQRSKQTQVTMPKVEIHNKRILIVDDNTTNREVLRGQLEIWGAKVTEAEDGKSALQILNQQTDNPFPVAILDMQMPAMDGATLGKRIRTDKRFDATKLIMMTSIAARGDAQYFADLGFSAYFPKPATTSDLHDALAIVLDGGDALSSASPLITRYHLKNLQVPILNQGTRILLVEDNPINQELARGLLQDLGYQIDIANNGVEAIEALQNAPTDTPYQLVLMDCQMPIMDGYEATRQIRSPSNGIMNNNITIIAMTANAMKGDREKCLDTGMNDYLSKPIDPDVLETKLKQWLALETNTSIISVTKNTGKNNPGSELPIWDKSSSLKRVRGRENNLLQLVKMFLDNIPTQIKTLEQAIEHEQCTEARNIAHAIKSVAGNMSGMRVAKLLSNMEAAALDTDTERLKTLWPQLEEQSQLLHECLQQYLQSYEQTQLQTQASASEHINNTDLQHLLQQLIQRLQQGDYIDPEEAGAISPYLPTSKEQIILTHLKEQISRFDTDKATNSIIQIATAQKIDLDIRHH